MMKKKAGHGGARKGSGRRPALAANEILAIYNAFQKETAKEAEFRAARRKINKNREADTVAEYLQATAELKRIPLGMRTSWIAGARISRQKTESGKDIESLVSVVREVMGRKKRGNAVKGLSGPNYGSQTRNALLSKVARWASIEFGKAVSPRMVKSALTKAASQENRDKLIIGALNYLISDA